MRIAIITEVFLPKIDGVVHRLLNLIRELERLGDELLVVCPEGPGCKECSVPVVAVPSFPFRLYPEYRMGLPDKLVVGVLEEFRPEVLHYVNPFAFGFRCYDMIQRTGIRVPSVFSFHTLYAEFAKQYRLLKPLSRVLWWLTREYHNRADMNVTVSSIMQEELVKRGFRRVKLWPPAVDSWLFQPGLRSPEMRARMAKGSADKKVLVTVSRLAPEKNISFLADVLSKVPNACLAIVGDGPHRSALERRFAGQCANFLGFLKGKELAAAYASADAFVYASETETMGNVVLEAMASGCPVVAPRAGGISSLVEHGETGMLYLPGNLEEAVRHTRQVLTDGSVRSRLVRAARGRAEGWNWPHAADQVRHIYRESIEHYRYVAAWRTLNQLLAQGVASSLVSAFKLMAKEEDQGGGETRAVLSPNA